MDDNKEQVQDIHASKENKQRERQRGSISVRRALMTTALAAAAAISGYAIGAQQSSADQTPNTPAATETLNPEAYSQLLEQYPGAQVHVGGKMELKLTLGNRNELLPKIRTSAVVENDPNHNIFLDSVSYPFLNGSEFKFNPTGTNLEIENYITVKGDNADQTSAYAPKQDWIVLTFTGNDGNSALGYVSLSDQTSEYWNVVDGGTLTSLDLFQGSSEINNFNETTITSNQ